MPLACELYRAFWQTEQAGKKGESAKQGTSLNGYDYFSEFLVCKAEPLGMHSQAEPGNEEQIPESLSFSRVF